MNVEKEFYSNKQRTKKILKILKNPKSLALIITRILGNVRSHFMFGTRSIKFLAELFTK